MIGRQSFSSLTVFSIVLFYAVLSHAQAVSVGDIDEGNTAYCSPQHLPIRHPSEGY